MRIALLSDVHANIHALDVVADELVRADPDRVVFLGDALGMGPNPVEVLARLRELCDVFVIGNADEEVLKPDAPSGEDDVRRRGLEIAGWTATRLDRDDTAFLASLPLCTTVRAAHVTLVAYHGSPRSFDERIEVGASSDELDELLVPGDADLYAGGHTHFQFVRRHRRALVVNPGSVGFAYDRNHPLDEVRLAPVAEFALVEVGERGLAVTLRRVPFDLDAHRAALAASGMPHADWIAAGFRRG